MNRFGLFPRLVFTVFAAVAAGLPAATLAEEKEPAETSNQPSIWMKKKMDYSQNILSGLATADFDKIAENAQAMQGLSKMEWFVRGKMPGYRTQLEIFLDANAEILKQAKQDNLEGSTLAFTQLTISCVNCHKQLRAEKKE
jgi:cytochrome c556